MTAYRYDTIGTVQGFERTSHGFLRVDARLTRTGVLPYTTSSGVRRELRQDSEVFAPQSLATARAGVPITVGHVAALTTQNLSAKVGQSVTDATREGRYLRATLQIEDPATIAKVEAGELRDISMGYTAVMRSDSGAGYDAIQTQIRYNHIALLPRGQGRAGTDVSLRLDTSEDVGYTTDMAQIQIGSETFEVPEQVASAYSSAQGQVAALAARADAAEAKVSEVSARADAADAQVASLSAVDHTPAIAQGVTDRLALLERVRASFPAFAYSGQSDDQIKAEVVAAKGVRADGKDSAWISGAFEAVCSAPVVAAPPAASEQKLDKKDEPKGPDAEREAMIARRNAKFSR